MLKKIRVAVSILIFSLLTFYFLDFAGILPSRIHVLGHIQFIPALLSHNAIIVCLIILALLFGRVYCSFICPMGVFQDIASRCSKKKFAYRKNNPVLRWSIVAITFILFLSGFTIAIGILDPYSAYGRIAVHIFRPIYIFANNILAGVFSNFGNYTFYKVGIGILSIFSLSVALLTFVAIGVLAWKKGRFYCNTICPVGTVLGFINKFSLFKIRINNTQCTSCGICEKNCKASCIDAKAKTIDYSRCVNCFNCVKGCNRRGVFYAKKSKEIQPAVDKGKRKFLLAGLAAIAAPKALAANPAAQRKVAISPPGSVSAERLMKRCTSCHLCVSKCPSKVLRPAFMEYGIGGMMMPVMCFERGFCNFDCTACSSVCPSHALVPLTKEQKHRLQVGKVIFIPELCVVHTNGTSCGACSEHCPTQAVKMVPYKGGLTIPVIDVDTCVGCGGCEFICPVRPYRAIYVEGNKVHQKAKAFIVEKQEEREVRDFGF
ncbi:MAG: 4Fe-4S dicluster domain-containing protein [Fibromonadaceae bacterium]|jgi:ferredoxin|nr:4Fe-4S dicluster domain-containing protein [Fibromonadaceae bacterium]